MSARAMLYELDFTAAAWADLTVADPTEIAIDPEHGLRLFGIYDEHRRLLAFEVAAAVEVKIGPSAVGAFRGFLAVDFREGVYTGIPEEVQTSPAPATPILYRVLAGSTAYYWTGAAWAAAGATQGNDLATLQARIADVALTNIVRAAGSLGFSILLATASLSYTPTIGAMKVLIDVGTTNAVDDLVRRSLVPSLEGISVPGLFRETTPAGAATASINLFSVPWRRRTLYRYTGITAVYDLTADPGRTVNLYAGGFTSSTSVIDGVTFTGGTVALTASIPAGRDVEVAFTYGPEVSVPTSVDYYEIGLVPEIQVRGITILEELVDPTARILARRTNPGPGINDSYIVGGGRTLTIGLTLAPRASSGVELDALGAALRAWAGQTKALASVGFGQLVGLHVATPGGVQDEEPGLIWRWDLDVIAYTVRDVGTATPAKAIREVELDARATPLIR